MNKPETRAALKIQNSAQRYKQQKHHITVLHIEIDAKTCTDGGDVLEHRQGAGGPNKHVQVLPLGRHGLQLQRVSVGALLVSCSSLGHWRLGPLLSSPRPCVAAFVSLCSCAPVFDTCWGKRQDAEGEESVHRRNCSTYPGAHGLIRVCLGARAFAVILRDRRGHHSCPREGVFFFCKYQMMKTVQSDPLYVPC